MATEINTIEDLDNIRNDLSGDYKLMNDLDFNSDDSYSDPANKSTYTTGSGWTPIGDSGSKFTGNFNGQGYTISNLFIDREAIDDVGLFGYINNSMIYMITLDSCDIKGQADTGGIVGNFESGTMIYSSTSGVISGSNRVGGCIGGMYNGEVKYCYSSMVISEHSGSTNTTKGGFIGYLFSGEIKYCYSNGSVSGGNSLGGFVGSNSSNIYQCYANTNVIGGDNLAGFSGLNYGTIKNCFAKGDISGTGDITAGFCAIMLGGSIKRCYSTGSGNFGFLGSFIFGSVDFSNFWDVETSETTETNGQAIGKTTSEMQNINTYLEYEWDIAEDSDIQDEIWVIADSYPIFSYDFLQFKEMTTTGNQIKVAESSLQKKENSADRIKFKCVYEGTLNKNIYAKYLDSSGNIVIDGKIKHLKEVANEPATGKKVYEITMYDKGIKFNEQNLNTIYDADQSPEAILQTIVEGLGFVFINNLDQASGVTLTKPKKYIDRNPIDAINDLCEAIGAIWRVDRDLFFIQRRSQNSSTYNIDGTNGWLLPEGWEDDTSRQCNNVIVKGAIIEQKTTENLTGTGTVFYTTREPKDMQISGLTQTTESIDGDYEVFKGTYEVSGTKKGKIVFETSQTDPTVNYSYDSQIRIEKTVDAGDITKEIQKRNITSSVEAREFARSYLDIYRNGFSTSKWETKDITSYKVNNLILGNTINVTNKLNSSRDGNYVITKIERRFPEKIIVTVGQDVSGLVDWQKEAKERIKQLGEISSEADFVQLDESLSGDFAVTFSTQFTHLFTVEETGEILFASDTTLTNDSDVISDSTGTYPMAVDDDGLSAYPSSYTDYLES